MGHSKTRQFPNDPSRAKLPPASSYRLYPCHSCLLPVEICSRCDRGNIYCKACAPIRKKERIQRARSAYRRTSRGREVRAAAEKRRRLRSLSESTVGDRGSPVVSHQGNNSASEHSRSDSGAPADEDPIIPVSPVVPVGNAATPRGFLRCSHCHHLCVAFQIQGPRRRRFSRRPRSRPPPCVHSDGGGAP